MTEQIESRAFLGLGGNLGRTLEHFRQARQQLAQHEQIQLLSSSPVYQTPPVGGPEGQPDYLNAVVEIWTSLPAQNLLNLCRQIEDATGRVRDLHWGPRTLDIDLLIFAELVTDDPLLRLPHPRLHQRHFVLLPLYDLSPQLRHPGLKMTIKELLDQLPPAEGITQFQETW